MSSTRYVLLLYLVMTMEPTTALMASSLYEPLALCCREPSRWSTFSVRSTLWTVSTTMRMPPSCCPTAVVRPSQISRPWRLMGLGPAALKNWRRIWTNFILSRFRRIWVLKMRRSSGLLGANS
uniref:Putative secreted protein n=1 Tax=Ixodes ricinus TaxID=34613 RepID=A0A6B0UNG7_IXORI